MIRGSGPAIHALKLWCDKDVDARLKAGHDDGSGYNAPFVMAALGAAIHVFTNRSGLKT